MKCPKCQNFQENTYECESCGIIFERYAEFLKKKENNVFKTEHEDKGNKKILILPILAVIILIIYFMSDDAENNEADNVVDNIIIEDITSPEVGKKKKVKVNGNSLAVRLSEKFKPRNIIEEADLATVFIKTAWGSGSGFFINKKCNIVTNRHVVEFNRDKIDYAEKASVEIKDHIEKEKKRLVALNSSIYMAKSEQSKNRLRRQYDMLEQSIQKETEAYNELVEKIDDVGYGSITGSVKVILKDGSEHSVISYDLSNEADLALLQISNEDCPYLSQSTEQNIPLGEKVYTIGNPSGLQHTVTSGIVSGYQKYNDKEFIQTDAPINPGNSGGPLISEDGKVVGINTMILAKTEGIGFAIPIDVVFNEFNILKQ